MKKLIWYFLPFFSVFPCFAQEQENSPINLVYQSTMLGVGSTSVYDTYLSPIMEYTGTIIDLSHEQIKMTGLMNGNVSAQHLFNLDFSWSNNRPGTASNYTTFIEYSYGLHYRFKPTTKLQLFVGPLADGMIGVIYNSRNGNNPATGKAHFNLHLSGIATYGFRINSQPVNIRYQMNFPFAGVMFSPHYGQSYYEISLGDSDNLAHFASFHNQTSMRNTLSVELPFNFMTLRLAYMNSIYETDINDLQTRIHSNSILIGFSKNFFSVPGKKSLKNNYKRVFE